MKSDSTFRRFAGLVMAGMLASSSCCGESAQPVDVLPARADDRLLEDLDLDADDVDEILVDAAGHARRSLDSTASPACGDRQKDSYPGRFTLYRVPAAEGVEPDSKPFGPLIFHSRIKCRGSWPGLEDPLLLRRMGLREEFGRFPERRRSEKPRGRDWRSARRVES